MWPEKGVSESEEDGSHESFGCRPEDAAEPRLTRLHFPKAYIPVDLTEAMCLLQVLGRENSAEGKGVTSPF